MSGTQSKGEKRTKVKVWFNDLFRTKMEIAGDGLADTMEASNENEVRGDTTFYYSRGGLQKDLQEQLGKEPKYIKLSELSVSYWCDVPKKLWNEFQEDAVFVQQLYDRVNVLTDKLVKEWVKRAKVWERSATEADAKGDKAGVDHALKEFQKDCVTLQKECQEVAIADIAGFFQAKAATYANYTRYQFKAGCKLAFTFVGLIVSVAALSTAATPAAPATLIPAIIGIASACLSAGKQIADLAASAEEIAGELGSGIEAIKVDYKDSKGKPKKGKYKAKDLTAGFVSGLTGGASDLVFPSVGGLMGLCGTHKSKLEGLDVRLHDMGNNLNALVTAMDAADKVLADNLTALKEVKKKKPTNKEVDKAIEEVQKSAAAFVKIKTTFQSQFNSEIPTMIERIESGMSANEIWTETLKKINDALGSKNWALVGSLFATLALTGIGFSSGAPSDLAEKVTTGLGIAWTGVDTIREYTPDMMESLLGEAA